MKIHLHTPTGRTYCGAPAPEDRVHGWTAWLNEATCLACVGTLASVTVQRHENGNPECDTWRVVLADGTTGPWVASDRPTVALRPIVHLV
jgi:hypothetical protein